MWFAGFTKKWFVILYDCSKSLPSSPPYPLVFHKSLWASSSFSAQVRCPTLTASQGWSKTTVSPNFRARVAPAESWERGPGSPEPPRGGAMCLGLQCRKKHVATCTQRAGPWDFTTISNTLGTRTHTLDQLFMNSVLCQEIVVLPLSHSHSSYINTKSWKTESITPGAWSIYSKLPMFILSTSSTFTWEFPTKWGFQCLLLSFDWTKPKFCNLKRKVPESTAPKRSIRKSPAYIPREKRDLKGYILPNAYRSTVHNS